MMPKRRTDQEWQRLFEQYQTSSLTQRAFCKENGLSLSTFYSKQQRLQQSRRFVKAQVIEKTTHFQATQPPVSNMTLSFNEIELSIPKGTPAAYLAELIGALS